MLPPAPRVPAQVTTAPGTTVDGIGHGDVPAANLASVRAGLDEAGVLTPVVTGGDCGVELAPVETAVGQHREGLVVVWLDAHGDLNTPASSPSGAFHGMIVRALLGEGAPSLRPLTTVTTRQIVLVGTRALDPPERDFVCAAARFRWSALHSLRRRRLLVAVVVAAGAAAVCLHIDLDVLDPDEFGAVGFPEPGGITIGQLTAAIRARQPVHDRRRRDQIVPAPQPRGPEVAGASRARAGRCCKSQHLTKIIRSRVRLRPRNVGPSR